MPPGYKKISQLPPQGTPSTSDKVPLVSGGTTDYALLSVLIAFIFNNIPAGAHSDVTRGSETITNFVASGLVWTADNVGVNRNASMTSGVIYINGRRIAISGVTARTFTASKDTYIDVLDNLDGTGTLSYPESSNGAASQALAANSVRIAKIITGATTIAATSSIAQTGIDSLNNWIYPTSIIGANSWKAWIPTIANLTIGNGTVVANYTQIGKTVHFELSITFGSTSSMGTGPSFTVPVAANSRYNIAAGGLMAINSAATMYDISAGTAYYGVVTFAVADNTKIQIIPTRTDTTWLNSQNVITANQPAASWATGDIFTLCGSYEAA